MKTELKNLMRKLGKKGGKATGESKRRGDSAYYRELSKKRKQGKKT
jgi:hypothetical protein